MFISLICRATETKCNFNFGLNRIWDQTKNDMNRGNLTVSFNLPSMQIFTYGPINRTQNKQAIRIILWSRHTTAPQKHLVLVILRIEFITDVIHVAHCKKLLCLAFRDNNSIVYNYSLAGQSNHEMWHYFTFMAQFWWSLKLPWNKKFAISYEALNCLRVPLSLNLVFIRECKDRTKFQR